MRETTVGQRAWWVGRWVLRATGPVLLVVLLVWVVDYDELRDVVGGIDLGWALAALAMVQLSILFRTLRWMQIHRAFGLPDASFGYQLRLTYAINLAGLVLPQIINPLTRVVLLIQDGHRAHRATAGVVLEKALDLAIFVGFGFFGSIVLASTFSGLVWWAVAALVGSVIACGAAYLLRSHLRSLVTTLIARLPGLDEQPEQITRDIVSLDRRTAAWLLVWSFGIGVSNGTLLSFLAQALGIDLSYLFMVALWGIVAFSMLLPLSINGLGTREAILAVAFQGVDRSTDAAVALGLLLIAAIAVGSAPGAVEWLRRFLIGGEQLAPRQAPQGAPVSAAPVGPTQGERGR